MRGKERLWMREQHPVGITPACAGKSFWIAYESQFEEDHPRVCGEKSITTVLLLSMLGSPPRVRGKGGNHERRSGKDRITPACAGKSTYSAGNSPFCGDHPRVCGEKLLFVGRPDEDAGSPPRVRGKVTADPKRLQGGRITPACAGKRLKKALKNKDF